MCEGHRRGEGGGCGCGEGQGHHEDEHAYRCGGQHGHGQEHGGGCGCSRGHHSEGCCSCGCHHGGDCRCGGSCACHAGSRERGFQRRFRTREEQITELETYLMELEAEAQGVREAIAGLRGPQPPTSSQP